MRECLVRGEAFGRNTKAAAGGGSKSEVEQWWVSFHRRRKRTQILRPIQNVVALGNKERAC